MRAHERELAHATFVDVSPVARSASQLGFGEVRGALPLATFQSLRDEASSLRSVARAAGATGETSYKSHIAALGVAGRAFLRGSLTSELLWAVLGARFMPSEEASCYTYYEEGDFLSRHTDRAAICDATVIVYLEAESPAPELAQTGLALRIFRTRECTQPAHVIPTRPGSLVVGRGSKVWHDRPVLQTGERVTALTACFRAARRE